MNVYVKLVLSILATAASAAGAAYQTNPTLGGKAVLAAVGVAVGAYIMGLFQTRPGEAVMPPAPPK